MTDLLILLVHTAVLVVLAWWYLRAYRRAARASRRRVERLLAADTSDVLRGEVSYLRQRNDILMRGLFPRGDVFPGNFIDEDPELRALCEVIELLRGHQLPGILGPGTPPSRRPN